MVDKHLECLVDARWMSGRLRGMGRYALQMVAPIKNQCSYATTAKCVDPLPGKALRVGKGFFPAWEQAVLPEICSQSEAEWLLCPYNTAPLKRVNTRLILVVHDLIFMEPWRRLPPSVSLYQNLGRLYRRFVVPKVIKKADRLVTVSEYTKKLIVERYNVPAGQVCVIPNALDNSWFDLSPRPLHQRQRFILSVAGEAPSKNVKRLLHAFSRYAKADSNPYELKIVGFSQAKHASFQKECLHLGVRELVEFVDYIDDVKLKNLYLEASAFIFPSLYEGFGIPLLEAMASGVPIICSNTTSLPEVVGEAALQFDPYDERDMAQCISEIIRDTELAAELVVLGFNQVSKFKLEDINNKFEVFWSSVGFRVEVDVGADS